MPPVDGQAIPSSGGDERVFVKPADDGYDEPKTYYVIVERTPTTHYDSPVVTDSTNTVTTMTRNELQQARARATPQLLGQLPPAEAPLTPLKPQVSGDAAAVASGDQQAKLLELQTAIVAKQQALVANPPSDPELLRAEMEHLKAMVVEYQLLAAQVSGSADSGVVSDL